MADKTPKDKAEKGQASKPVPKKEKGKFSPKKLVSNMSRSAREMKSEFKKIVWPTKKQVLNNTVVVIVMVIVSSVFLGGLDFVFKSLVDLLLRNA